MSVVGGIPLVVMDVVVSTCGVGTDYVVTSKIVKRVPYGACLL